MIHYTQTSAKLWSKELSKNLVHILNFRNIKYSLYLLSNDIRSEGSITIVKKLDLDFLMIFDSISFPHSKKSV